MTLSNRGVSLEELTGRVEWVMRRNERILKQEGRIDPDFYFGRGPGSLLYEQRFEKLAHWMNDGHKKEVLFSMVRHTVEAARYDCVVFASDMWGFKVNERGAHLSKEDVDQLRDHGFKKLMALGYGKTFEHVSVLGQTQEHVVMISKEYKRDALNPDKVFWIGPPTIRQTPSVQFGGRSKMFGDWREPGMREAYKRVGKAIRDNDVPLIEIVDSSIVMVNIAVDEP